jgi:hypothetical protein
MGEDIVLAPQGLREGYAKVFPQVQDTGQKSCQVAGETQTELLSNFLMDMPRERVFHKVHPHAASHDYLHFSGRFRSF